VFVWCAVELLTPSRLIDALRKKSACVRTPDARYRHKLNSKPCSTDYVSYTVFKTPHTIYNRAELDSLLARYW
jgi:hypothetical protein